MKNLSRSFVVVALSGGLFACSGYESATSSGSSSSSSSSSASLGEAAAPGSMKNSCNQTTGIGSYGVRLVCQNSETASGAAGVCLTQSQSSSGAAVTNGYRFTCNGFANAQTTVSCCAQREVGTAYTRRVTSSDATFTLGQAQRSLAVYCAAGEEPSNPTVSCGSGGSVVGSISPVTTVNQSGLLLKGYSVTCNSLFESTFAFDCSGIVQ
jgi:hypothetical protein